MLGHGFHIVVFMTLDLLRSRPKQKLAHMPNWQADHFESGTHKAVCSSICIKWRAGIRLPNTQRSVMSIDIQRICARKRLTMN